MVNSPGHTVTGIPLLETKLYIPRACPDVISRPSLIKQLAIGAWRPLTLVSAPAGFGKTTLISEWIRQNNRSSAWISLDANDNNPSRFLSYLIAALKEIHTGIDETGLDALQASPPSHTDTILTAIINQIASTPDEFILVLDDYHEITSMEVNGLINFMLHNMPPQMHLVIITRADPPLPLSRLRGRGQMTELREADLRLTRDETHEFLKNILGFYLSPEHIDALENRTEGWIAGLQMAALSMKGRENVSEFITAFTGDDRYIMDYLIDEVLQRQPDTVQSFLMRSSILERLSGALCDAVTDRQDGNSMLDSLERANLFVVSLDDKRQWYRYHRLFADVLRARLHEQQPDWEPVAHLRASVWYEREGAIDQAVGHAIAAKDFDRAANLIEAACRTMTMWEQLGTPKYALVASLRQLPNVLVRSRPLLSVLHAWSSFLTGAMESVESRLQDAERGLDPDADEDAPPNALTLKRSVLALVASARAFLARLDGDFDSTIDLSLQALSVIPEEDPILRDFVSLNLGRAYWIRGDLTNASQTLSDIYTNSRTGERYSTALDALTDLARLEIVQGHLHQAADTFEQVFQIANQQGQQLSSGSVDAHVGMGQVLCEWGRLAEAEQHLLNGIELSNRSGRPRRSFYPLLALSRLKQAQGDIDGALEIVQEVERADYGDSTYAQICPAAAFKARLWIAQGRVAEALRWARNSKLSTDDAPSYRREFEHLTLVRTLMARCTVEPSGGVLQDALGLLERLLDAAESGGRTGSMIEILVLKALAHQELGDIPKSLASLEHVLSLAEPEGYVQSFVDEGEAMRILLRHAAAQGVGTAYAQRLLASFEPIRQITEPPQARRGVTGLVNPLTEREVEILRLISAGMTNQQIADHLVITLDTVKRHVTHIYGKLDVRHRAQAIVRAQELGLK